MNCPAKPLRVLVADDDRTVLNLLCRMLTRLGYEVTGCRDGVEALDGFKKRIFHLVLTDLQMPRMDGWELVRQIKALSPHLPVIALTGQCPEDIQAHLPDSGFDHILYKPFDIGKLNAAAKRALKSVSPPRPQRLAHSPVKAPSSLTLMERSPLPIELA
ncbi:MAG: response regulator [Desulfobacterales bacterium]